MRAAVIKLEHKESPDSAINFFCHSIMKVARDRSNLTAGIGQNYVERTITCYSKLIFGKVLS